MTVDMPNTLDMRRIERYLKAFDFKALFVEELGWNILKEGSLLITVGSEIYTYTEEERDVLVEEYKAEHNGKESDLLRVTRRMRIWMYNS